MADNLSEAKQHASDVVNGRNALSTPNALALGQLHATIAVAEELQLAREAKEAQVAADKKIMCQTFMDNKLTGPGAFCSVKEHHFGPCQWKIPGNFS